MKKLGGKYDSLDSYYAGIKPVMLSELMCYGHISGIFTFYSMEANYNTMNNAEEIGHTVCHELSHMTGFMREDEANFIGWLAAVKADKAYMNYSGWLVGFIYAGNALAKYDMETYTQLHAKLDRRVRDDLAYGTAYWKQYEGPVAEIHEQVNDAYLKINHQSDGVESYGRMVELMLAYYEKEMD